MIIKQSTRVWFKRPTGGRLPSSANLRVIINVSLDTENSSQLIVVIVSSIDARYVSRLSQRDNMDHFYNCLLGSSITTQFKLGQCIKIVQLLVNANQNNASFIVRRIFCYTFPSLEVKQTGTREGCRSGCMRRVLIECMCCILTINLILRHYSLSFIIVKMMIIIFIILI